MYVFFSEKYKAAIIVRRTLTTTKNIAAHRTTYAKILRTFKQGIIRPKYLYLVQAEFAIKFDTIKQICAEVEKFEQEIK